MKSDGVLFYFVLTLVLSWLFIATSPSWSRFKRYTFYAVVTALAFVGFGSFQLSTGKSVEDNLFQVVLCPLYEFRHCRDDAAEQQRLAAEAERERSAAEAERQRKAAEAEWQRQADEAERKRQEAEARAADAERKRKAAEDRATAAERRSLSNQTYIPRSEGNKPRPPAAVHAATVVGKVAPLEVRAFSSVNQLSKDAATSNAYADCNRSAQNCRLVATFGGPGKCVYLANGTIEFQEFGRTRTHHRVKVGWSESEAMHKCQAEPLYGCRVFYKRCNN